MMKDRPIRWGILGLGKIARSFAHDIQFSRTSRLHAVGSRSIEKAKQYQAEYFAEKAYGSYEELLKDPDIDVVYISTPHSLHYPLMIQAMDHGKAVLCEKPLTVNARQTEEIIKKQEETGLFVMEALWTRFLPAYRALKKEIEEHPGRKLSMNADFCFTSEYNPSHRLYNPNLAGGSLLDIGIYPVFLALDLMGEPEKIQASGFLEKGIDIRMSALFEYEQGRSAMLYSDIKSPTRMEAVIRDEDCVWVLPHRWHHLDEYYEIRDQQTTVHRFPKTGMGYYHEIVHVDECLRKGLDQSPLYPLTSSLKLMKQLDRVREKLNFQYPEEIEKI